MEQNSKNEANGQRRDFSLKNELNHGSFGNGIQNTHGHFDFLAQKSQRLATALYMLTNLFELHDPLRLKLREQALLLVSDTMSLTSAKLRENAEKLASVFSTSLTIVSFCEIAYAAHMISEMNHTILKKEFHDFMDALDAKKLSRDQRDEENSFSIPSNFFEVQASPETKQSAFLERNNFERNVFTTLKLAEHQSKGQSKGYKGQVIVKDKNGTNNVPKESLATNRKDVILNTFRQSQKGALSIKDISEFVKDCSEKTIQRQLIELVKNGVLDKKGERRWSMYSLKR